MPQYYMNRAQQEAMLISAHTEVIIASRRMGKSHGIVAPRILRNATFMPRGTGGFLAKTFRQAYTRTLPAALAALDELGYKRDIHYVIGRRPPRNLGYATPLIEPATYDNNLTFFNGSRMAILSQDVALSTNSMTLDWLVADEAKGLDYDKMKDETLPALGGARRWFSDCPWHHGMLLVSDMPATKAGSWLLNYREKCDEELISTIAGLMAEHARLAAAAPSSYRDRTQRELEADIAQLRRVAVYYREWSIFENIDLVGLEYVRQMKRDLPPLVFATSILSKRITKLKSGFYPNFSERIHTYIANNNKPLLDRGYDFSDQDYGCLLDGDLDAEAPIAIAFDYNANINWLVAGQRDGMKMRILKSFYVKYQRKLRELVDDFCHYYRYHKTKKVIYYYDSTALGSNYAVNTKDFASVVVEQFVKNGWEVERHFLGKPMEHRLKYQILDDCFKGRKYILPLLNSENNEALILALSMADITIGRNGFSKDKAGEKLAESEDDPLELRTDGTDAFDTLVLGNIEQPYNTRTRYFISAIQRR